MSKIKEIIEELGKFPQEAEVYIYLQFEGVGSDLDVSDIQLNENGEVEITI